MANLAQARRRLIATFIALVILDLIAVILMLAPLLTSSKAQREEEKSLHESVQQKLHQVIAPDQLQTRIVEARKQIDAFYKDRLPSESSSISDTLGKLAAANSVTLSQAKYQWEDTGLRDLRRVTIEATLVGNYLQEVKFINALERARLLFLVDSVVLGEQTGGNVRLQLKLETYLKGQA
jgi:Tfp pilus assembly protein PilO